MKKLITSFTAALILSATVNTGPVDAACKAKSIYRSVKSRVKAVMNSESLQRVGGFTYRHASKLTPLISNFVITGEAPETITIVGAACPYAFAALDLVIKRISSNPYENKTILRAVRGGGPFETKFELPPGYYEVSFTPDENGPEKQTRLFNQGVASIVVLKPKASFAPVPLNCYCNEPEEPLLNRHNLDPMMDEMLIPSYLAQGPMLMATDASHHKKRRKKKRRTNKMSNTEVLQLPPPAIVFEKYEPVGTLSTIQAAPRVSDLLKKEEEKNQTAQDKMMADLLKGLEVKPKERAVEIVKYPFTMKHNQAYLDLLKLTDTTECISVEYGMVGSVAECRSVCEKNGLSFSRANYIDIPSEDACRPDQ